VYIIPHFLDFVKLFIQNLAKSGWFLMRRVELKATEDK